MRVLCLIPFLSLTNGFLTPNAFHNRKLTIASRLKETSTEAELREEIARKNILTENEAKYGVIDGEFMEEKEEKDIIVNKSNLERALKARAYPLFLMEKGAQIMEDILKSESESLPETKKERIVVLGTGWGAVGFLKDIDFNKYTVTVISPRNFFVFTPMLAGASVGTVDYRSITEPIRQVNTKINYLEATASSIDLGKNIVSCDSVVCEGNSCSINSFDMEFDRLILSVGAQTNTFGIPGVREHCCFLKQVEDAQRIRNAIVNCFERANLPNLTDEERGSVLTFCVIGAGPTGVEFASELRDFIEQDAWQFYPSLLKFVKIKVIEASSTILAPFDKSLQEAAMDQLTRRSVVSTSRPKYYDLLPQTVELTELLLDSGVSEVKGDKVLLNDGKEIPYGICVWAAGIGPLPITLDLIESLSEEQKEAQSVARGRIAVDPWLRVIGSNNKIFSLGDCSCIVQNQLPATAQVASQQGEYLARILSSSTNIDTEAPLRDPDQTSLSQQIASFAMNNGEIAAPFQFLNLGILAYTGSGSALAQINVTPDSEKTTVKSQGKLGFGLWRSVYLSKQVSWRNRFLVFTDWVKAQAFGRDITRV